MIGKLLQSVVALAGVALAGGFGWFVHVATMKPATPLAADGIVVLTGGSNRIGEGFALLAAGRAGRLLISGVKPGTPVAALPGAAGLPDAALARVTLGQSAISTRGNAEETRQWVRRYALGSLIVVTAYYHMPRALEELRRAVPNVVLRPDPVVPAPPNGGLVWRQMGLLAEEYVKFLLVRFDLPRLGGDRRPDQGLTGGGAG